jgi:hypothetical protein
MGMFREKARRNGPKAARRALHGHPKVFLVLITVYQASGRLSCSEGAGTFLLRSLLKKMAVTNLHGI